MRVQQLPGFLLKVDHAVVDFLLRDVRRIAKAIAPWGNTYLALSGLAPKWGESKPRPLAWASLFRPFGANGKIAGDPNPGGETVSDPFSSPGFRCCYSGCGSTLPRASSVASSSSAVSSSVKSRIFFWRADWGIARISGVRGVNNRSWVFSERLAQVSPKGAI